MTYRIKTACLSMGFLVSVAAFAEAAPAAPAAAPAAPTATAAPAAPAAAVPAKPAQTAKKEAKKGGGDIITLKSGKVLKDLKIIGRAPNDITIRIISGVTMTIPRKQIESIKENCPDSTPGSAEDTASPQNDLTPEALEKLAAPLSDPTQKWETKDAIAILEEISKKCGVTFIVDEAVRTISQKDRTITVEAKEGMNAMNLIQDEILTKVKKMVVVFQGDKLLFTTKDRTTLPNQPAGVPAPATANPKAPVPPAASAAPAAPAAAAPEAKPSRRRARQQ